MSKQLLCVGDLVCDIVMPVTLPIGIGDHQNVPTRRIEPGGAGTFMFAACNMGLKVTAAGTVGDDALGTIIIDSLADYGIDTSAIFVLPNTTSTLVTVLVDVDKHEHVYVGSYGEGPPIAYPEALENRLSGFDGAYFLGYTFAEERTAEMAMTTLKKVREAGIPVYFDVGPFMGMVPAERIKDILSMVDVIITTEDEVPSAANQLTGQPAYDYLLSLGPKLLVIKRGAEGCQLITADLNQPYPGYQAAVVDTVGAGDCFGGAFVACHLNGLSLDDCAQVANAMGTASVAKLGGGHNAPTLDEVKAVLTSQHIDVNLP